MSAKDISRFLFQPEKHYASVRMQQGRIITDDDFNARGRIYDEETRRTLLDIVCAKGTSNRGFQISGVTSETRAVPSRSVDDVSSFEDVPTVDFAIAQGNFYLGGLRFEVNAPGETFLDQRDWLQLDADQSDLPTPPAVDDLRDGDRFDLVYLRGWEQCVTAVEDSELLEQALGGPDTSTRVRLMRRVEVLPKTAESCAEAFEMLKASLVAPQPPDQSGESHEFDASSCELRSKARLTVGPGGEGVTEDPCRPKVEAGFIGAENQTIRVELTATNRFIWGIDNAAPYYRVQVLEEDNRAVKIKFLTLPRDQQAQPLKGQAVEIHPWGAVLPNKEKVAELQGHLATVETSYDPESHTLTIADPVPNGWLEWFAHPNHAEYLSDRDPDGQRKYFYLRLWTGGSGDADSPDFEFTPGDPVDLRGTGLAVTFTQHGLPSDHWIIAARPHTPSVVVPWELMNAAPPAGTRQFFAPLAIIRWSLTTDANGQAIVRPSVHDCRGKFRPLCEIRGCCTVTVGDGLASHGDFQSIQDAVDSLPSEGGKVCVLPGVHETSVTILGRKNIRIHGCGKQTLIVPSAENRNASLFRIIDSRCLTLERMDMVSLDGTAIVVTATPEGSAEEIEIAHNRILACREAIRVETAKYIDIRHNHVRILDKADAGVGIALSAEDARIERNDVGVVPADLPPPNDGPGDNPDPTDPCEDPERVLRDFRFLITYLSFVFQPLIATLVALQTTFKALGGIQIAAGAERVKVLENAVNGGAGNGITLGGVIESSAPGDGGDNVEGHVVVNKDNFLAGIVKVAGAVPDQPISFVFTRGETTITVVTDEGGGFNEPGEPGEYVLTVTSPGFEIDEVRLDEGDIEFRRFEIDLSKVVTQPDPGIAFLYDIDIACNDIRDMGLSGIGIPGALRGVVIDGVRRARLVALRAIVQQTGNPVIGLGIRRNLITRCLRRIFDDTLRSVVKTQGLGGISVGICAYVDIRENQIEHNGRDHVHPVCGVFVGTGVQLEIQENVITNNGPIDRTSKDPLEKGERGGVVVKALSLEVPTRSQDSPRPAARVHDNIILQPAGQALRVIASGAVSVCNNRLTTEMPEPVEASTPTGTTISVPAATQPLAGTVNVINLGDGQELPSGATLFNDNQIRLASMTGVSISVLVSSGDDVGFDANQSEVLEPAQTRRVVFANTLIRGHTLRAIGSRFQESLVASQFSFLASLVTGGQQLNNTSHNQGDHCIFVTNQNTAHPAVQSDNQVINTASCGRFVGTVDVVMTDFSTVFRS